MLQMKCLLLFVVVCLTVTCWPMQKGQRGMSSSSKINQTSLRLMISKQQNWFSEASNRGFMSAHKVSSVNGRKQLLTLRGGATSIFTDATLTLVVAAESLLWVKIWTTLASNRVLDSKLTRKIIHSGSAPLFIAHWPLYSDLPHARWFAGLIPFLQIVRSFMMITVSVPCHLDYEQILQNHRLYLAGTRRDYAESSNQEADRSELIQAVSRTGNRGEALGGPLLYSVVLLVGTVFFFRESSVGIVAMSQMAAGDGFADIVGRRFGTVKWPFAPSKSIAGSVGFVVAGFAVSVGLLALMNYTGVLLINVVDKLPALLGISVFSAAVELIPGVDDNISVPVAAAIATAILL